MSFKKYKKPVILGVLFFLPVIFLLFLYPSTHNYNALDIVKGEVEELSSFKNENGEKIYLKDQITVLGFLGEKPNSKSLTALNLKELIYDKFRGFKKFQVVIIVEESATNDVEELKKTLNQYEELKYWQFAFSNRENIEKLFKSLRKENELSADLSSDHVFIIDKELNQRGRLDDREDNEKQKNSPVYSLLSYDCIEVAELKNKMSEDMRILFTEYRQKRKGTFNSTTRRADDLKDEKN